MSVDRDWAAHFETIVRQHQGETAHAVLLDLAATNPSAQGVEAAARALLNAWDKDELVGELRTRINDSLPGPYGDNARRLLSALGASEGDLPF